MAEVLPFRALRYTPEAGDLGALVSPPYDVISDALRDDLYERSPHNLVRVEWGKEGGDRYARAHQHLLDWRRAGLLRLDERPAFYVHDHEFDVAGERARRRGIFGALRLHGLDEGVVLPHERTFPKARSDRLALLRATSVNTSPVFGLYDDHGGAVAELVDRFVGGGPRPLAQATVGAERHLLWAIEEPRLISTIGRALAGSRVYIADGHHRYETALEHARTTGGAGADHVLAYLASLDDPGLRIFPTHRLVRGGRRALDGALKRAFTTVPAPPVGPFGPRGLVLVRDGTLTALRLREDADLSALREAWRNLPVAHAELLLEPARQKGATVTYEHDAAAAIAAADGKTDALLVEAVSARTLQRIADAGERLPEKTTYFFPKVPAGLVLRALDA